MFHSALTTYSPMGEESSALGMEWYPQAGGSLAQMLDQCVFLLYFSESLLALPGGAWFLQLENDTAMKILTLLVLMYWHFSMLWAHKWSKSIAQYRHLQVNRIHKWFSKPCLQQFNQNCPMCLVSTIVVNITVLMNTCSLLPLAGTFLSMLNVLTHSILTTVLGKNPFCG